jgi:hypothetical protein
MKKEFVYQFQPLNVSINKCMFGNNLDIELDFFTKHPCKGTKGLYFDLGFTIFNYRLSISVAPIGGWKFVNKK